MKNGKQPIDKNIKTAILNVFPSVETFSRFKQNDPVVAKNALPAFFRIAWKNGLIPGETEAGFNAFIREETDRLMPQIQPVGLTFDDLIEKISGDRSVNALVESELKPIAGMLKFPRVQASMISRLRKKFNPNTRTKQNLLRVLAFWIGLNRPFWG